MLFGLLENGRSWTRHLPVLLYRTRRLSGNALVSGLGGEELWWDSIGRAREYNV